jgi:nicotinamidase-related amidase
VDRGYYGTLVKDATAAFSKERMHAAHELNGPTFAHAILAPTELLAALPHEWDGSTEQGGSYRLGDLSHG